MERKSSKENSAVFLVKGEEFKLRIYLRGLRSPANSAQRLSSRHLAAVLTPNLAELVPSVFLLLTTMVFAAFRTHFPRKNTRVYLS